MGCYLRSRCGVHVESKEIQGKLVTMCCGCGRVIFPRDPDSIPFVNLHAEHMAAYEEIDEGIDRVISSCNFIGGEEVTAFENELAEYQGVGHAVSGANATQMMELTLRAIGIGEGDSVITTPCTAFPTVEAIMNTGAKPIFVDIEDCGYNICQDSLDAEIVQALDSGFTPVAIIPVHLYGIPCDMESIQDTANNHCIPVIEDCAQAQGARHNGQLVGTFGDAAVFSFFPSKPLGCFGDGGAMTGSKELCDKVRCLANHGKASKFEHVEVGTNCRLDAIQAAVLRAKLPILDERNEMRDTVAGWYGDRLAGNTHVTLPLLGIYDDPVWHIYPVRVVNRDGLRKHLKANGIDTGCHYPIPLHLQPVFRGKYSLGDFPNAERAFSEQLSLPMFATMTEEQVDRVCDCVINFVEGK